MDDIIKVRTSTRRYTVNQNPSYSPNPRVYRSGSGGRPPPQPWDEAQWVRDREEFFRQQDEARAEAEEQERLASIERQKQAEIEAQAAAERKAKSDRKVELQRIRRNRQRARASKQHREDVIRENIRRRKALFGSHWVKGQGIDCQKHGYPRELFARIMREEGCTQYCNGMGDKIKGKGRNMKRDSAFDKAQKLLDELEINELDKDKADELRHSALALVETGASAGEIEAELTAMKENL